MTLIEWAFKHNIPSAALQDLCWSSLWLKKPECEQSETSVQREMRLAAARKNKYLYRNNRGAGKLENGSWVRWGLANDSKLLGDAVKSGDLIGLESVLITPEMVGTYIGRFLSVEVKTSHWKFSGTLEECAQIQWATIINAQGGRAIITNDPTAI
jgi:hypothetical protein